jgi:hypothetical protein
MVFMGGFMAHNKKRTIFKTHRSHIKGSIARPFGKFCKISKEEEMEWLRRMEMIDEQKKEEAKGTERRSCRKEKGFIQRILQRQSP